MTEIKELLAKINLNPSCLAQMDWVTETHEFAKYRILEIIRGIAEAELRKLAGEYIAEAWYDACELDSPFVNLKNVVGYNEYYSCDEYEYRFQPKRPNKIFPSGIIGVPRIEDFIQEQLDFSQRKEERELKLQHLQLKTELFESATPCEESEIDLGPRWEDLDPKDFDILLCEECALRCPKIEETKQQARIDAQRELVENLIIYAEGEDKKVAREIKIALNAKMANGCIASNVLTDEWKQRFEDLGRDKTRNNNLNFNNQVGTVVAHADHVNITTGEHE